MLFPTVTEGNTQLFNRSSAVRSGIVTSLASNQYSYTPELTSSVGKKKTKKLKTEECTLRNYAYEAHSRQ